MQICGDFFFPLCDAGYFILSFEIIANDKSENLIN